MKNTLKNNHYNILKHIKPIKSSQEVFMHLNFSFKSSAKLRSRGVQKNRKTEKTEKKLTEKTEPKKKPD